MNDDSTMWLENQVNSINIGDPVIPQDVANLVKSIRQIIDDRDKYKRLLDNLIADIQAQIDHMEPSPGEMLGGIHHSTIEMWKQDFRAILSEIK